jgi:penicillin amidase
LAKGTLSELYGIDTISIDRFSRKIGFERIARETLKNLDEEDRLYLQAYSDGINDFVSGISMFGDEITSRALPPEFHLVGLKEFEPWTPIDSLCQIKLMNFHLSWNWGQDLVRDHISSISDELKDMIEEILPFTSEFSHNLVTMMDESDARRSGIYSDDSLLDRENCY